MKRIFALTAGLILALTLSASAGFFGQNEGFSNPPVSGGGGTPLSLDGTGATGAANTAVTSVTATITTANPNDIIGACIINTGLTTSSPTVTSVAGSGGSGTIGSFTQRSTVSGTIYTTQSGRVSLWWASASTALTNKVITATVSANSDTLSIIAFAVTGAGSQSTPFDTNVALPASGSNTSGTSAIVQTTGVSTSHANDMLISCASIFGNASSSMPGPATGWTDMGTVANVGSAIYSPADSEEKIVAATQSSSTIGWKTGGAFDGSAYWMTLADAIQGN